MKAIRKIVLIVAASVVLLIGQSYALADSHSNSATIIEAYKAPFHVGENVMACGAVVEIKRLSKMTFLNLDKNYPSQSLSILIWNNNLSKFRTKFGDLGSLVGDRVCVLGTISMYKNNLQIKVSNENFLRLMR